MTTARFRNIINSSLTDCSILLRFVTDSDHVTADVVARRRAAFKLQCIRNCHAFQFDLCFLKCFTTVLVLSACMYVFSIQL